MASTSASTPAAEVKTSPREKREPLVLYHFSVFTSRYLDISHMAAFLAEEIVKDKDMSVVDKPSETAPNAAIGPEAEVIESRDEVGSCPNDSQRIIC